IGSSIDAARSVFNDVLKLDRSRIEGKVHLVKSRLTVLSATDAYVGGTVELRLADIRVLLDMTGLTVNGDVRLQRLSFGRQVPGIPSCDYVQNNPLELQSDDQAMLDRVTQETVKTRPSMSQDLKDVCTEALAGQRRGASNEVLLRDMKIKGTLCLIDVTGEILGPRTAEGDASRQLK